MRALLLGAAVATLAGEVETRVEIEDQIDLVHFDRRILAVNAQTGGVLELDLELGEEVVDLASRGVVGVATTSVRLLGVTTRSANFQELRYRIQPAEAAPAAVHMGDRVVLVRLATRLVALGPATSGWVELGLGPGEAVLRLAADSNVAAAVTERRAIAFSARGGSFVEAILTPQERIEAASVEPSSITLTTSRRILIFRARATRWVERVRTGGLAD